MPHILSLSLTHTHTPATTNKQTNTPTHTYKTHIFTFQERDARLPLPFPDGQIHTFLVFEIDNPVEDPSQYTHIRSFVGKGQRNSNMRALIHYDIRKGHLRGSISIRNNTKRIRVFIEPVGKEGGREEYIHKHTHTHTHMSVIS